MIRVSIGRISLALLGAFAATAPASATPPSYVAIDLGTMLPGATAAYVRGIDADGRIVGIAGTSAFDQKGFVTGPHGAGARVLLVDGQYAEPMAIAAGRIACLAAGHGCIIDAQEHRIHYYPAGRGPDIYLNALNAAGTAVGMGHRTQGSAAVSVDEHSPEPHRLGTFGGTLSVAYGINGAGTIVGEAADVSGILHPFVTDAHGRMAPLPLEDDARGIHGVGDAHGINDRGQVVGSALGTSTLYAYVADTLTGAVRYVDPGALGAFACALTGINGSGQVIGYEEVSGTSGLLTIVSDREGVNLYRLDSLVTLPPGVNLMAASVLNDPGEIAATGSDGHVYLLEPADPAESARR